MAMSWGAGDLHKTPTGKITKHPQTLRATLKLKYPVALRNIDQMPVAGGKITIQLSKFLFPLDLTT